MQFSITTVIAAFAAVSMAAPTVGPDAFVVARDVSVAVPEPAVVPRDVSISVPEPAVVPHDVSVDVPEPAVVPHDVSLAVPGNTIAPRDIEMAFNALQIQAEQFLAAREANGCSIYRCVSALAPTSVTCGAAAASHFKFGWANAACIASANNIVANHPFGCRNCHF